MISNKTIKNLLPIVITIAVVQLFPFWGFSQKYRLSKQEFKRWEKYTLKNDVYISAYFGHGSYSMSGLSNLQADIIKGIGVDAHRNSNFPPYWLYGLTLAQKYDNARFGFVAESMSTGARYSLADYSGQFYSDIICRGVKLGVFLEKDTRQLFSSTTRFKGGFRLEAGGLYNNIYLHNYAVVYDLASGTMNEEVVIEVPKLYIEPALYATYTLSKYTYLQLSVGLMLNVPSEINSYSETGHVDYKFSWNGYRLRLAFVQQL